MSSRPQAIAGSPIRWIVTNWRLKLLSLVLTVGLLTAVAFSENPPTFATVPVRIQYVNLPPNLVVVNPLLTLNVQVVGLRDDVERYRSSAVGVTIDLARARAGPNQVVYATPKVDVTGVTPRQGTMPIRLTIEPLVTRLLDIQVLTPKKAPGVAVDPTKTYATCGNAGDRCQVTVSGAASIVDKLSAYVDYDVSITTANTQTSPNQPVQFMEGGRPIDLGNDVKTQPTPQWTPEVVTVQVVTEGGSLTKTLGVQVKSQGTQPCGYAITGLDVQPAFVTVTGPISAVGNMTAVQLDSPVNLNGLTSSTTFARTVVTDSPDVAATPSTVRVTVNVLQQVACGAPAPAGAIISPSPFPSPPPHTPASGTSSTVPPSPSTSP